MHRIAAPSLDVSASLYDPIITAIGDSRSRRNEEAIVLAPYRRVSPEVFLHPSHRAQLFFITQQIAHANNRFDLLRGKPGEQVPPYRLRANRES